MPGFFLHACARTDHSVSEIIIFKNLRPVAFHSDLQSASHVIGAPCLRQYPPVCTIIRLCFSTCSDAGVPPRIVARWSRSACLACLDAVWSTASSMQRPLCMTTLSDRQSATLDAAVVDIAQLALHCGSTYLPKRAPLAVPLELLHYPRSHEDQRGWCGAAVRFCPPRGCHFAM